MELKLELIIEIKHWLIDINRTFMELKLTISHPGIDCESRY